jgi:hypothetical protein
VTDHDWEVDGGAGGAAGGTSGSASRPEPDTPAVDKPTSDARSAKVVPFPGNWFGSVDELVPVHPEPVPIHPEPVPIHLEPRGPAVEVSSPVSESPSPSAADASDFWEGDAATLQEVGTETDSSSSIALLRSPAAARRKSAPRGTASGSSSSRESESAAVAPLESLKRPAPLTALAMVLLAAVVAGVLLAVHSFPGISGSGASRHAGRLAAVTQHKTRVVTQTLTSTVTLTTRPQARNRRHGGKRSARKRTAGANARGAASGGTSSAQTGASSTSDASSTGAESSTGGESSNAGDSSDNASPPVTPSHSSVSTGSSGSGCVVSPDSGCLP